MLEEKTFQTQSGTLNYAEGPASGRPPVLLLHGIQTNWTSFMPLISMLGLRWHIFALDFRGHGKSSWVTGQYRIENYAQDVVEFIESAMPEPPAIFGESLGGMVGIMVAAENPDSVRALIVGDSLLYREAVDQYLENFEGASERQELIRSISDIDEMAGALEQHFAAQQGAFQRYAAKCFTKLDPDIQNREVGEKYDCEVLLPKITCPTLLLQSALLSDDDVERALGQLSKGYAVRFPDMGHLLHLEPQGYEVVNTVSLFLESLDT